MIVWIFAPKILFFYWDLSFVFKHYYGKVIFQFSKHNEHIEQNRIRGRRAAATLNFSKVVRHEPIIQKAWLEDDLNKISSFFSSSNAQCALRVLANGREKSIKIASVEDATAMRKQFCRCHLTVQNQINWRENHQKSFIFFKLRLPGYRNCRFL